MISWSFPELEPVQISDPVPPELPYVTLALDPVTGDLAFPVKLIRGAEAVLQKVRVRFRFFAGEWFLDQRLGVPYYRDILIKNPDTLVISTVFRGVLTMTPGVKLVTSFSASLDTPTRTLTVDFDADLDDGSKIVSVAEPFIFA